MEQDQVVTSADAAAIVEDIALNWRALPDNQQDYWRRELVGRDMALAVVTLEEIKQQGSEHPPTWAHFNARYGSRVKAAREIAETEARIAPVQVNLADDPKASSYVRVCQAYCRRIVRDGDRSWLVALFGENGPRGEHEFAAVMRPIAATFDELDGGMSTDDRAAAAIDAHLQERT